MTLRVGSIRSVQGTSKVCARSGTRRTVDGRNRGTAPELIQQVQVRLRVRWQLQFRLLCDVV